MANKPELRIALAMRGGVSLAVWMGGACSEINALRDATARRGTFYEHLLEASGYSGVSVDVIAGASAGGLNGALLAGSIVHGMPFGRGVRNLWLQLGDIAALARSRSLRPPSVLDGDGGFYRPLRRGMSDLLGTARPPSEGARRLDLTLTGTLFNPRASVRYQDLGAPIVEARHRVRFRFRHLSPPPHPPNGVTDAVLSDFGTAADREMALARLAYAARATSSFPGAFEPASIGFAASSSPVVDPIPSDHHGVYSETRNREDGAASRDYVIDGGVLDNIPVAWALRAIAAAPADRFVHRWLVYMQPVPFPPLGEAARRRPDMRATVKRARRLRSGTETLTDDLDELERIQRDRLGYEGYRQVVEYALGEQQQGEDDDEFLGALFKRALAAAKSYRDRLGLVEASRMRQLWSDPLPVLGADALGYRDLEWVNRPRAESSPLIAELAAHPTLPDAVCAREAATAAVAAKNADLEARTAALVELGRKLRTPQVLARTVGALLDSVRQLGSPGLELKGELYKLRSDIEVLIACHDRQVAAEPFKSPDENAVEVARRAARRLSAHGFDLGRTAAVDGGWPDDPYGEVWDRLTNAAGDLADTAVNVGHDPDTEDPVRRAVLGCLTSAARGGETRPHRLQAVLVALEVLTGPARPDPLAETSTIRFHMLSAANDSPLSLLRRNGRTLTVDEKLAGNQLANFGAFLRARWRQNDWTWGRLDAARSLVDILTATHPTGSASAPQIRPDWASLQRLAGVPPDASRDDVVNGLVSRLQTDILREELPALTRLGGAPPNDRDLQRLDGYTVKVTKRTVRPLLRTGRETILSAIVKDPLRLRIALRLAQAGALGWSTGMLRATASDIRQRIFR